MSNEAAGVPGEGTPTLAAYAARVTIGPLERMLEHAQGVRENRETEPVHQMRVWSRRTRAALDVFAACFPDPEYRRLAREARRVTRALGEARDLDVMIEALEKRAESLPPEQQGGVLRFVESLRDRRAALQPRVEKAVTRFEVHDPVGRFLQIARRHGALPAEEPVLEGAREAAS